MASIKPVEEDFTETHGGGAYRDGCRHARGIAKPRYRVSAFFYRYRRTILGMDAARARADLDRVWQSDPVWTAFIRTPAE